MYWSRDVYYDPSWVPQTMGWMSADYSSPVGAWQPDSIGSAKATKYMAVAPTAWADTNTGGKYLLGGKYRVAGDYSRGPTLYAIGQIESDTALADGSDLPVTTLLEYSDTNTVSRYVNQDEPQDVAFVTAGSKEGVVFSINKGTKEAGMASTANGPFYGQRAPYAADCVAGKSYNADPYYSALVWYKASDLADVAASTKQAYEPQPYAYMSMESYFYGTNVACLNQTGIGLVTFDEANSKLYVVELAADGDYPAPSYPVVHVFSVANSAATALDTTDPTSPTNVSYSSPSVSWDVSTDDHDIMYTVYKNHGGSYGYMSVAVTSGNSWTDPLVNPWGEQKFGDKIITWTLDGKDVNFYRNTTVTGVTSGATALITGQIDDIYKGQLYVTDVVGTFSVGETIKLVDGVPVIVESILDTPEPSYKVMAQDAIGNRSALSAASETGAVTGNATNWTGNGSVQCTGAGSIVWQ